MLNLSVYQYRFWLEWKLNPQSTVYNTREFMYRIHGDLDSRALENALNRLINEYFELGRTAFIEKDGTVMQEVLPQLSVVLHKDTANPEKDTTKQLHRFIESIVSQPFDLAKPPLFKFGLFEESEGEYILILNFHHIILDPTCAIILIDALSQLYNQELSGGEINIEIEKLTDYINHEQETYTQEHIEEHTTYWKNELKNAPLHTDLKFKLINGETHEKIRPLRYKLDAEKSTAIKKLTRKFKTTPFMFMAAAFATLLSKYDNEEYIVLSYPFNVRPNGFKKLPGCFVNNLPLKVTVREDMTFAELAAQVTATRRAAKPHQNCSLTDILSNLDTDDITKPLNVTVFETMMTPPLLSLNSLTLDNYHYPEREGDLDLGLAFQMTDTIELRLDYRLAYFPDAVIEQMLNNFVRLLDHILENPEGAISSFSLLSKQEKQKILVEWNKTDVEFEDTKTIHELFQEQAKASKQNIALIDKEKQWTYGELDQQTNQLTHLIIKNNNNKTLTKDSFVLAYSDSKSAMCLSFLAILKAGGCYVPLEAAQTDLQLQQINEECQPSFVICGNEKEASRIENCGINKDRILILEHAELSKYPVVEVKADTDAKSLAYVIYTSGSTGKPKGAMIEHKSVVSLIKANKTKNSTNDRDIIALTANMTFDPSIFQIFEAWLNGAALVAIYSNDMTDPEKLHSFIDDNNISVLNLSTGLLEQISSYAKHNTFEHTRHLLTGGDMLKLHTAKKILKSTNPPDNFYNVYGPTETCCNSTIYQVTKDDLRNILIPIGRPVANTKAYILDQKLEPTPVGIAGELYISGTGVARGYVNEPELTASKFIDNPFEPNTKMYKTGDRACWAADGNLLFFERLDHQVKIRGYRIDISEIEEHLRAHENIPQAIVTNPNKNQLVAYYRTENGECLDATLHDYLAETLPEYKIPSLFVHLEKFPLNKNGKIDKKALRIPDTQLKKEHKSPKNNTELTLKQLWEKVLKLKNISTDHRFSDLGGHSLSAVALVSEINKRFKLVLPVAWINQHKTIESQAASLQSNEDTNMAYKPIVKFRKAGWKTPLFLIPPDMVSVAIYSHLASLLPNDQPCFGIEAYNLCSGQAEIRDTRELAKKYVEYIKSIKPHGPYKLAGWSNGGSIALAITEQLSALGDTVETVYLFDSNLKPKIEEGFKLTFEMINDELLAFKIKDEPSEAFKQQVIDSFLTAETAGKNFDPFFYSGKVVLFKANRPSQIKFSAQKWSTYLKNLTVVEIDAYHGDILRLENLGVITQIMSKEDTLQKLENEAAKRAIVIGQAHAEELLS